MTASQLFESIFNTQAPLLTPLKFILCIISAVVLGVFLSFAYYIKSNGSKSFAAALALLPAAVCAVIMVVSGNIGAGIAVVGAFGLVRFRSAPGGAREICAVFISMGAGLICGAGYLAYASVYTLLMGMFFVLFSSLCTLANNRDTRRILRITVPEDINYTEVFDDALHEYAESFRLISAKTYAMGSMYRLKYEVRLKNSTDQKAFIDALRCRNGNLEVSLSVQADEANEL